MLFRDSAVVGLKSLTSFSDAFIQIQTIER